MKYFCMLLSLTCCQVVLYDIVRFLMSSYTPLLTNEKGVNEHGLKVIL